MTEPGVNDGAAKVRQTCVSVCACESYCTCLLKITALFLLHQPDQLSLVQSPAKLELRKTSDHDHVASTAHPFPIYLNFPIWGDRDLYKGCESGVGRDSSGLTSPGGQPSPMYLFQDLSTYHPLSKSNLVSLLPPDHAFCGSPKPFPQVERKIFFCLKTVVCHLHLVTDCLTHASRKKFSFSLCMKICYRRKIFKEDTDLSKISAFLCCQSLT